MASVRFDASGIQRTIARIENLSAANLAKVQQRALSSVARGLKAEAARQVSAIQLNLTPRQISPYIIAAQGSTGGVPYVAVSASNTRLPLTAFSGAKVSKSGGVTVQTWLDSPALVLPHAFKAKGQIWQRIPQSGATKQYKNKGTGGKFGLVGRLPIVVRKGPSLKRALQATSGSENDHGRQAVVDALKAFAQTKIATEIQRLMQVFG